MEVGGDIEILKKLYHIANYLFIFRYWLDNVCDWSMLALDIDVTTYGANIKSDFLHNLCLGGIILYTLIF
jgi:hypothetical protein